jgi:hypothetical protein
MNNNNNNNTDHEQVIHTPTTGQHINTNQDTDTSRRHKPQTINTINHATQSNTGTEERGGRRRRRSRRREGL